MQDGTSNLALVFNNAQTKNGTVIPIKSTIVAVATPAPYPGSYGLGGAWFDYEYANANHWTDRNVDLALAAQGTN